MICTQQGMKIGNDPFEEQLARRKRVALAKLQEQMDKLRQQMLDNGDYVVPDPWRLESEEYRENKKSKSILTSDLLDLPQKSYLKEWKPNDTIPLAITKRWELLTYHLNSIVKQTEAMNITQIVTGTTRGSIGQMIKTLSLDLMFWLDISHPFEVLWIGRF